MRKAMFRTAMASATAACFLVVAAASAQQNVKPAVRDKSPKDDKAIKLPVDRAKGGGLVSLEIYNGPMRTVRYFSDKGRLENDALAKLEMAENQMELAREMMALRQKYINDESVVQARRRALQEDVYGLAPLDWTYAYGGPVGTFYGNPPIAQILLPNFNPGFFSVGLPLGVGGAFYGGAAYGVPALRAGGEAVADEGPIKAEMAKTMAKQATPEYLAQATRDYQNALAALDDRFPDMRASLNLPKDGIRVVAPLGRSRVILFLKDSKEKPIDGEWADEDENWIRVNTTKGLVEIRKSVIDRIERPKPEETPKPGQPKK